MAIFQFLHFFKSPPPFGGDFLWLIFYSSFFHHHHHHHHHLLFSLIFRMWDFLEYSKARRLEGSKARMLEYSNTRIIELFLNLHFPKVLPKPIKIRSMFIFFCGDYQFKFIWIFLNQILLANSSHCMENNIPISEKTISVTCQFSLTGLPNAS